MNCRQAQRRLPGYVDGAIDTRDRTGLRDHLASCGDCRRDLDRYRIVAARLATVDRVVPPVDLAMKIRVRASQRPYAWSAIERFWSRFVLGTQNILQPLAVPATGGVLTAIAVFIFVTHSMIVGMHAGSVVADDLPLDLVQPAQLESLAPFPVPGTGETDDRVNSSALLIEATLDAQGQVVDYRILSGPTDNVVRRQIDQVLLFSRFRPQLGFGRPMGGGRVLLNFNQVRVRG
jgi:hypothetical protein